MAFLRQDMREITPAAASWAQLEGAPERADGGADTGDGDHAHAALPPSPAAAADAYRAELGAGAR